MPSLTRNPAARSRSSPGVRMVRVSAWPPIRMPSGSSAASRSARGAAAAVAARSAAPGAGPSCRSCRALLTRCPAVLTGGRPGLPGLPCRAYVGFDRSRGAPSSGVSLPGPVLNWPVYRQLTGRDGLGRGDAVRSPHTEHAQPRTETADRVVAVDLPVLRGGLRPAGLRAEDRRARTPSPRSRVTRTRPVSRGRLCPKGAASKQLVTHAGRQTAGAVPPPLRHRAGSRWTWTRRWT